MKTPVAFETVLGLLRRQNHDVTRRGFLQLTGVTGGGLVIASIAPGLVPSALAEESPSLVGSAELNAYVSISDDGTITIYSGSPEMGQGIKTSLPMIVAEELGADWDDVVVVQTSEVDAERYGRQSTGGSYTVFLNWNLMRQMGATAREMFIAAGAIAMELPADELKTQDSRVVHIASNEFRTFAELASLAYRQTPPEVESLVFRERQDYRILGTSKSQVDSLEIVTGVGDYGIDTRVPNMLYGCFEKCPAPHGVIVSANLEVVKKLPGITDAYLVKGNGNIRELSDGVGIVGTSTWAVMQARKSLEVQWDESDASKDSWTDFAAFAASVDAPAGDDVVVARGDVMSPFADENNQVVEADYEFPYVSHLCLEPMNCTADYRPAVDGGKAHLEVWLPTQNGGGSKASPRVCLASAKNN